MEHDGSAELVTPPLDHPLPAKPTLAAAVASLPPSHFVAAKTSAVTSSLPSSPHAKRSPLPPGSKPPNSAPGSKPATPTNHKPTASASSSSMPFKPQPAKPKISAAPISVSTSSVPSKRPAPSLKGVKLVKKKDKGPPPSSQDAQTPNSVAS